MPPCPEVVCLPQLPENLYLAVSVRLRPVNPVAVVVLHRITGKDECSKDEQGPQTPHGGRTIAGCPAGSSSLLWTTTRDGKSNLYYGIYLSHDNRQIILITYLAATLTHCYTFDCPVQCTLQSVLSVG